MSKHEWVQVHTRISRNDVSAAMALSGASVAPPKASGPIRTYREDVVFGFKRRPPVVSASWVRKTMRRHWLRTGRNPYRQNLVPWLGDGEWARGLMPAERADVRRLITFAAATIASYVPESQSEAGDTLRANGARELVVEAMLPEEDSRKAWPG